MSTDLGPSRPFPGLRPYESRDHEWFFGREDQTLSLYRLLDRGRLLAVVGSSGSGKSSLVKAGLLPVLAAETAAEGGPRWRSFEMKPGDSPLDRLTEALSGPGHVEGDEGAALVRSGRRQRLGFLLRASSFGLLDSLRDRAPSDGATPLLLVDQFEELFRFADLPGTEAERSARRQEAAAFVQLLLEATRGAESRLRVILTLRSDYLGDCARFHGLPDAVTANQFLVPSLTRDQREEAIRGPITRADGAIGDELVERLLFESTEELDQLPVLQHALMRTWSQSANPGHPTGADYERVGGVASAIAQHADSLLEEPALARVPLAVEQVFRALAELDRYGRAIRRPLPFRQLVNETGEPEADVRTVVDRFRRDDCSFLLPPFVEGRPLDDDDVIDIAHESLIRRWTRMTREVNGQRTGWLLDEVADGRTYVALAETARGAVQPALLPLDQVDERRSWWSRRKRTAAWAERYGGRIDTVEKLIADSAVALEKSSREREEARQREAEKVRLEEARVRGRQSRREVLTRTQGIAFLGVAGAAMLMNFPHVVYAEPPFSWAVLVGAFAFAAAIFFLSPRTEAGFTSATWHLSLDQSTLAYYALDLGALAYLIWRSGGLDQSPFTIFLLLLPMNAILLEETFSKVSGYFGGVFVVAVAIALVETQWPLRAPDADAVRLVTAQIVLLAIAFITALVGYQRLDRERRGS